MAIIDISVEDHEAFRGELASIAKDGKRKWIYARQPEGRYYRRRTILSIFLLIFLFGAPFVRINGHPFMLLNILERKFVILGMPFMPQDFHLVVLLFLTLLVTIVLFTAVVGRVWCGWLCPQTIFMEMVFRKIEYFIEGTPKVQIMLDKARWDFNKFWRKGLKHIIFFALSFLIANCFLSYIIGTDALWSIITDNPQHHLAGLASITIFSFVFYAVFARFREQACVIVCPYGRYQSALVDNNTMAVTYDFKRGEPRKKFSKEDKIAIETGTKQQERGDCIDCHQCVTVCPTGIDIRNGIQLECVNCTACIDACDVVMDKIKKPRGLIRYTSYNAVKTGVNNFFSGRVRAYFLVWLTLVSVVVTLFVIRPDTETVIMRQPGTLYSKNADGSYVNFYIVQITNKTYSDIPVSVQLVTPEGGTIIPLGMYSHIAGQSSIEGRVMVSLPPSAMTNSRTPVLFNITAGDHSEQIRSTFLGPDTFEHHDDEHQEHHNNLPSQEDNHD